MGYFIEGVQGSHGVEGFRFYMVIHIESVQSSYGDVSLKVFRAHMRALSFKVFRCHILVYY